MIARGYNGTQLVLDDSLTAIAGSGGSAALGRLEPADGDEETFSGIMVRPGGIVQTNNIYQYEFVFDLDTITPVDGVYYLSDNPGIRSGVFTAYVADQNPDGFCGLYFLAKRETTGASLNSPAASAALDIAYNLSWTEDGNFGLSVYWPEPPPTPPAGTVIGLSLVGRYRPPVISSGPSVIS